MQNIDVQWHMFLVALFDSYLIIFGCSCKFGFDNAIPLKLSGVESLRYRLHGWSTHFFGTTLDHKTRGKKSLGHVGIFMVPPDKSENRSINSACFMWYCILIPREKYYAMYANVLHRRSTAPGASGSAQRAQDVLFRLSWGTRRGRQRGGQRVNFQLMERLVGISSTVCMYIYI